MGCFSFIDVFHFVFHLLTFAVRISSIFKVLPCTFSIWQLTRSAPQTSMNEKHPKLLHTHCLLVIAPRAAINFNFLKTKRERAARLPVQSDATFGAYGVMVHTHTHRVCDVPTRRLWVAVSSRCVWCRAGAATSTVGARYHGCPRHVGRPVLPPVPRRAAWPVNLKIGWTQIDLIRVPYVLYGLNWLDSCALCFVWVKLTWFVRPMFCMGLNI